MRGFAAVEIEVLGWNRQSLKDARCCAVLLHVPAANLDDGSCRSKFASPISRRKLALFAGQQRNVIVLPENRQNLLAILSLVYLQTNEKSQALVRIFPGYVCHCLRPFAFSPITHF